MAAALPAIYAGTAIRGAGAAAYGAYKMSDQDMPKVEQPPEIPIEALPDGREQRTRSGRQSTILSSPLSSPSTYKPTLLGQ